MPDPMDAGSMAARITAADPPPHGTLRIFGDWFGRPYDNIHMVVSATVRDGALVIAFDAGEELSVTNPTGLAIENAGLRIDRADHVRLEWHTYGQPKTPEHLNWQEHWLEEGRVRALAGVAWFAPSFSPSLEAPAVDLIADVDPPVR